MGSTTCGYRSGSSSPSSGRPGETTPTVDPHLVEMMSAVFAAHCEHHGSPEGLDELQLGLARLTGSEASGGSGAGWVEAAELLRAAAWYAASVPLAGHDLLACWLTDRAITAGADGLWTLITTTQKPTDSRS